MKINKLFKKVIAAVTIAAVTIATVTVASPKNVQAAEKTLKRKIMDNYATAYIYDDGSGYIDFEYYTLTKPGWLTEIAGVPLKDIITFNDGGYIDGISAYYVDDPENADYTLDPFANVVYVHGRGPEGLFNGAGYLHFTDESGDTYNLSIWLHMETYHQVRYSSRQPIIRRVSWNS